MPSDAIRNRPDEKRSGPLLEGREWVTPLPIPRAMAWIMDALASIVITLSLHRGVWILTSRLMEDGAFMTRTFTLSTWFIGFLGYWVVVPTATGGMPGMIMNRLRIVSESGKPLGLTQVVLRQVIGFIANAGTLGLGLFQAFRDPHVRSLADRIAGTRLVQFTIPLPEVYRAQDLVLDAERGILSSEIWFPLGGDGTAGARESGGDLEDGVQREQPEMGAYGPGPRPAGPSRSTLYARPTGESAWERKQRAARGPGPSDLGEALRNTARLVADGSLMQKVLDRKVEEFKEAMQTVSLEEGNAHAVQVLLGLHRDGILTKDDLKDLHGILKARKQSADQGKDQ